MLVNVRVGIVTNWVSVRSTVLQVYMLMLKEIDGHAPSGFRALRQVNHEFLGCR